MSFDRTVISRCVLMALACLSISITSASENPVESTYSHAVFPQGPDAPENKVRFPEIEGDISFRILCDADVARDGKILELICHTGDNFQARRFQAAVYKGVRPIRLVPASVNNEKKRVWMQFSVEFQRVGDQAEIAVFPNHGHDSQRYGRMYQAAGNSGGVIALPSSGS